VIHQNLAHQVGRDGQELRPILTTHWSLINQAQIRLMNKRSWLESVVAPFPAQRAGCQSAEFTLNDRHKIIQCRLLTATPGLQQSCYLAWLRSRHLGPHSHEIVYLGDPVRWNRTNSI
jgi:hypothetical protein